MPITSFNVTSVVPLGGPTATIVTVLGSGFGIAQGTVTFDPLGTMVNASITSWVDGQIVFTVPALITQLLDGFVLVSIQNQNRTDGYSTPFWIPSSTPITNGIGYQLPDYELGTPFENKDDPTEIQACDINRLLDRIAAGSGGSFPPEPANEVFAGPVSGAPALPTFRLLVPDDIPDLPYAPLPLPLADLAQSGATNGQGIVWSGTMWAPGETSAPPLTETWGGAGVNPPPTLGQTVFIISQSPTTARDVSVRVNGVSYGPDDLAFTVGGVGNTTITWVGVFSLGPTDILDVIYFA
jgi:hypothetical protein